jgi:hypothetical protein
VNAALAELGRAHNFEFKLELELGLILSRKLWERRGSGRRVARRKERVKGGVGCRGINPRAFVHLGFLCLLALG